MANFFKTEVDKSLKAVNFLFNEVTQNAPVNYYLIGYQLNVLFLGDVIIYEI